MPKVLKYFIPVGTYSTVQYESNEYGRVTELLLVTVRVMKAETEPLPWNNKRKDQRSSSCSRGTSNGDVGDQKREFELKALFPMTNRTVHLPRWLAEALTQSQLAQCDVPGTNHPSSRCTSGSSYS
jgi:hypothetical protein